MIQTRRTILVGASMALAVAVLASPIAFADSQTLRFAHNNDTNHPLHMSAVWAAEQIEQRTDGRYKIEIFPNSILGSAPEIHEALNLGSIDIGYHGAGFMAEYYPPAQAHLAPFIWSSSDQFMRYVDSDVYADIVKNYQQASGNRIVGLSYYGARHITSNKEITSAADLRGLKIRVPPVPVLRRTMEALGTNPTPIAFAEVYLALQQGTVDAQENPLPTIQGMKFHEVQSHITLTGHLYDGLYTVIGSHLWEGLTEQDQRIFEQVFSEASKRAGEEVAQAERELVQWFKDQGLQVNEIDREALKELTVPMWTDPEFGWTGEQLEAISKL